MNLKNKILEKLDDYIVIISGSGIAVLFAIQGHTEASIGLVTTLGTMAYAMKKKNEEKTEGV